VGFEFSLIRRRVDDFLRLIECTKVQIHASLRMVSASKMRANLGAFTIGD
jgi:hypothetical protein